MLIELNNSLDKRNFKDIYDNFNKGKNISILNHFDYHCSEFDFFISKLNKINIGENVFYSASFKNLLNIIGNGETESIGEEKFDFKKGIRDQGIFIDKIIDSLDEYEGENIDKNFGKQEYIIFLLDIFSGLCDSHKYIKISHDYISGGGRDIKKGEREKHFYTISLFLEFLSKINLVDGFKEFLSLELGFMGKRMPSNKNNFNDVISDDVIFYNKKEVEKDFIIYFDYLRNLEEKFSSILSNIGNGDYIDKVNIKYNKRKNNDLKNQYKKSYINILHKHMKKNTDALSSLKSLKDKNYDYIVPLGVCYDYSIISYRAILNHYEYHYVGSCDNHNNRDFVIEGIYYWLILYYLYIGDKNKAFVYASKNLEFDIDGEEYIQDVKNNIHISLELFLLQKGKDFIKNELYFGDIGLDQLQMNKFYRQILFLINFEALGDLKRGLNKETDKIIKEIEEKLK